MIDFETVKTWLEFLAVIVAAILAWMNGRKIAAATERNDSQIYTQNGGLAAIDAKVNKIADNQYQAVQTTVVTEAAPMVAGAWSDQAKKALEKALPVGATITGTYDSETAHVVYWTVKR